mmetsp:Transcript_30153/g.29645  ORF Transcript_30153/g.29645 Transcript_30153/m.29645 type:complete len:102 (+) Transcript_30153:493-798(+)|eukprot:CAMPEP_0197010676 /NCGR_PEP_ID=MMETSP1380-20130617/55366_1 /TAXON_ID=5936 /ORGANISM="Euplotes crassus, Strain CT5" /LENGTH=101 /DNA_ID=CAMNT_0042432769 /DNA_START=493 /DNA_END=798 /DNA_ORIENTATION=+
MISFFKKKCLKSKILAEEIELLKKNEEREKATEIVKSRYSPKPDHPSGDDLVENTKQNYDSIDIFTDEEINLDKLGTMFLKIHKNSELKYSVLFDEFGEGN